MLRACPHGAGLREQLGPPRVATPGPKEPVRRPVPLRGLEQAPPAALRVLFPAMGHQFLGQHQGEDAAFARRAVHIGMDPAQQLRQVARDRQAQARAAVFAVGAAIGLAEGFEDQFLLVLPMPVP